MIQREVYLALVAAIASAGCAPNAAPPPEAPPAKSPSVDHTVGRQPAPIANETVASPETAAAPPPVTSVEPPNCASWLPDAACEAADMVRRDCEAMVDTLDARVSAPAFDCGVSRPVKNAVCGVSFATCVREELNRESTPRKPHAECAAVEKECTQRRDARRKRYGRSSFEPWVVTLAECERALAIVSKGFEDDLFECLRFSCHPTACFTGGPAGLVGRRAHARQRRRPVRSAASP